MSAADSPRAGMAAPRARGGVGAELIAVLVAVASGPAGAEPRVLTIADGTALPSGPLKLAHRSLQAGLRDWSRRRRITRSVFSNSSIRLRIPTATATAAMRFRSAISG